MQGEPGSAGESSSPLGPIRVTFALLGRLWHGATRGRWKYPIVGMIGLLVGLGVVTLRVSNATSYLSDEPVACINCHVMTPYYASWERSSHREVATCNDCHVPHDGWMRTAYFKALDGLRHATIFTLRMEPQVLKLNAAAVPVVQRNCLRCHEHQIMNTAMGKADNDRLCWDCHREVPHGLAQSLSSSPHVRRPGLPSAGMPTEQTGPSGVPGAAK